MKDSRKKRILYKRLILSIFVIIFVLDLIQYASSEIVLNKELNDIYNLGNFINIPITVKALEDTSGTLQLDLICKNGTQINFYKNGISLLYSEEISLSPRLVLIPKIIGENKGECKIKISIDEDYILTNQFKMSDLLIIRYNLNKANFNPEEDIFISGTVKKEDETSLDGFIDFILKDSDKTILTQILTVNKGNFDGKITLPSDIEAKEYFIELKAYEKDKEEKIINTGEANSSININQVPKKLIIFLDNEKVKPEEILKITSNLYDQTGKEILIAGNLTILNEDKNVIETKEINTGVEFEYKIKKMELPSNWTIKSNFGGLEEIKNFEIDKQENININLENQTLIITNEGNIPYNKTLSLDIGNKSLNLNVSLDIGESKKYMLNAPNGEYDVKIYTSEDAEISKRISLTGNAIKIKEVKGNVFNSYFLGFIILIILLITLSIMRKKNKRKRCLNKVKKISNKKLDRSDLVFSNNNKNIKNRAFLDLNQKNFISKEKDDIPIEIYEAKKEKPNREYLDFSKESSINIVNKAELSLSLHGESQESTLLCLKIKDLEYYFSTNTSIHDTLIKILQIVENNKGVYYLNKDYIFFIFSPSKTKTMKNEEIALNCGEEIIDLLNEHNKKFLQKINFGMSLNKGKIVAKIADNVFKFMVLDSSMTQSKKMSSLSNNEFVLSQEINDLFSSMLNSTKEIREGNLIYTLSSIKKEDDKTKKFIERFLKRQQE